MSTDGSRVNCVDDYVKDGL